MSIPFQSRASEPPEYIEVGEELTTCGHCGARTILRTLSGREEECLYCGQHYHVNDEIETMNDLHAESEMTDEVLRSPEWGSF